MLRGQGLRRTNTKAAARGIICLLVSTPLEFLYWKPYLISMMIILSSSIPNGYVSFVLNSKFKRSNISNGFLNLLKFIRLKFSRSTCVQFHRQFTI